MNRHWRIAEVLWRIGVTFTVLSCFIQSLEIREARRRLEGQQAEIVQLRCVMLEELEWAKKAHELTPDDVAAINERRATGLLFVGVDPNGPDFELPKQ
jgi:hypothetical protein